MQIGQKQLIGIVLATIAVSATATSSYFTRMNEIASKPHVVIECDIGSDAMELAVAKKQALTFQLCLDWQLNKTKWMSQRHIGAIYFSMIQIWSDGKGTPIPWDGWTDSHGQLIWRP